MTVNCHTEENYDKKLKRGITTTHIKGRVLPLKKLSRINRKKGPPKVKY